MAAFLLGALKLFVAWFFLALQAILAYVLYLVVRIFDFSVMYSLNVGKNVYTQDIFRSIWSVVRDLSNVIFIFILFFIATYTILRLGQGASLRNNLAKILIVAVLVNFSFTITSIVIDVSNVVAVNFYDAATTNTGLPSATASDRAKAISSNIIEKLGIQFVYNLKGDMITPGANDKNLLNIIVSGFIGVAVLASVIWTFLKLIYVFLVRMIVFIFLIVLSPAAFVLDALPSGLGDSLKGLNKTWWKKLTDNAIIAPVQMFFIYMIILTIACVQGIGVPFVSTPGAKSTYNSSESTALAADTSPKINTNPASESLSKLMPSVDQNGEAPDSSFDAAIVLLVTLGLVLGSTKATKVITEGVSGAASSGGSKLMSIGKAAVAGAVQGGGWAGAAKGAATAAFVGDKTGSTAAYTLNAKLNKPPERPAKPATDAKFERQLKLDSKVTPPQIAPSNATVRGDRVQLKNPITTGRAVSPTGVGGQGSLYNKRFGNSEADQKTKAEAEKMAETSKMVTESEGERATERVWKPKIIEGGKNTTSPAKTLLSDGDNLAQAA